MSLEGNAPIVELELAKESGGVRKARFLVDAGGEAVIIGSKVMADITDNAANTPQKVSLTGIGK